MSKNRTNKSKNVKKKTKNKVQKNRKITRKNVNKGPQKVGSGQIVLLDFLKLFDWLWLLGLTFFDLFDSFDMLKTGSLQWKMFITNLPGKREKNCEKNGKTIGARVETKVTVFHPASQKAAISAALKWSHHGKPGCKESCPREEPVSGSSCAASPPSERHSST